MTGKRKGDKRVSDGRNCQLQAKDDCRASPKNAVLNPKLKIKTAQTRSRIEEQIPGLARTVSRRRVALQAQVGVSYGASTLHHFGSGEQSKDEELIR